MNIDPLTKNDIISRWKSKQSIRGIAKDTQIGREVIARVIRDQVAQTQSINSTSTPACFGPVKLTRKSKLDPFLDSLKQLLERYPNITAQRTFEELCKLGYSGSYSTLRTYIEGRRSKPKAPVIRFETPPGAQAQMDWSTYTHYCRELGGRVLRAVENNSAALAHCRLADRNQRVHPKPRRDRLACMQAKMCINALAVEVVETSWTSGKPIRENPFETQRLNWANTQKHATIPALPTNH